MSAPAPLPLSHAPRHGDLFEVAIAAISEAGHGLAVVDTTVGPQAAPRRYTFEVRKAVVGDVVSAFVETRRKQRVTARVAEIVRPSPDRVPAPCPHYGQREVEGQGCGGCTQQALAYPAQLEARRQRVKRLLAAAGVDPDAVGDAVACEPPWRYRNKMEFSFGDDRQRRFALGLYPSGWRNEIVPLTACHLVSEGAVAVMRAAWRWAKDAGLAPYNPRTNSGWLRQLTVREGVRTGDRLVELVTAPTGDEVDCDGVATPVATVLEGFATALSTVADVPVTSLYWTIHHAVRGEPTRFISQHLRGEVGYDELIATPTGRDLRFNVHPRAFFQPNPRQAVRLVGEVVRRLPADARVLDLYCGTGVLGQCLAPSVERVDGVELIAEAVDNARENAARNGLDNVAYWVGDVTAVLRSEPFAEVLNAASVVLVDPPRAGLAAKAVARLLEVGAPRIIYVSCNPRSLGRDLAALIDGGYALDGPITPVDMFPQTHHIENVVALTRSEDH